MLIHGIKKEGEGKKKKAVMALSLSQRAQKHQTFPSTRFKISRHGSGLFLSTPTASAHARARTHTLLHRQHLGTATSDSVEAQNHQLSSPNVDLFWAAGLLGFTLGLVAVISHISQP